MFAVFLAIAAAAWVEAEPDRVLLAVLAPPALAAQAKDPVLYENAERSFRRVAHVEVVGPEQLGISASELDACAVEVRSSCWAKIALTAKGVRPRVLVILSLQPDAAALVAFDLRVAAAVLREDNAEDQEKIERTIWKQAVRAPRKRIDPSVLGAYFANGPGPELSALLARVAPLDAHGTLVIEGLQIGAEVELDGKTFGAAPSAAMEISGVMPGSRVIKMHTRSGETSETVAEVLAGAVARAKLPEPRAAPMSPVLQISLGAGGVVAGVSLVLAGAIGGRGPGAYCLHPDASTACDRDVPQFELGPGGVARSAGERGAPPLVIMGSGLFGAGVAWSIATFAADELSPWWRLFLSAGAGVAASLGAFVIAR